MKELLTTKTFWAGVSSIVAAVGCYCTGECSLPQMLEIVSMGLIGIFLRHGLVKK